jgi:hypothetical protein
MLNAGIFAADAVERLLAAATKKMRDAVSKNNLVVAVLTI